MNKKNIDNFRFLDIDRFWFLEITPFRTIGEDNTVRDGFKVDGVTVDNVRIEKLYYDLQSGSSKLCEKWIIDNWLSKK